MKTITFLVLMMMALTLASCGGKSDGGGSKSISQLQYGQAFTKHGYYNTQTQALEIDNVTYPPSPAYSAVMNQAIQQAQAQGVQPVMVNGVQKFKATISGTANNFNTGYANAGYNPAMGGVGQQQQQLNLTSVVFYR